MNKGNVMVVDDHSMIRKSLSKLLLRNFDKIDVIEAKCGEEALEKLGSGLIPELILLDISIPGMGGIETCRRITNDYPDLKVVMLTLHDEQIYVNWARDCGVSAFIYKGESHKLLKAVRDNLQNYN